jgi:hypothetical protein
MSNRNQSSRKTSPRQSLDSRIDHPTRLEKLAQARRLLSLRQLDACRQIAREVLREDPADPIALGLLELSDSSALGSRTGGLREGKESPAVIAGGKKRHQEPSPAQEPIQSSNSPMREPFIDPQFSYLLALTDSPETISKTAPPQEKTVTAPVPETDTLRERTISALVDILHNRENTVRNWSDPRFPQGTGSPGGKKQRTPFSQTQTSSSQSYQPTLESNGILLRTWNRLKFWKKKS